MVVVQGGRIIAERYAPGLDARSTHLSWSVAKSVTHAVAGVLVGEWAARSRRRRCGAPEWADPTDDERGAITAAGPPGHALRAGASSRTTWTTTRSDCLEMLFGAGADDVAGYAAGLPLEHPIDAKFNYSSGTTNIVGPSPGPTWRAPATTPTSGAPVTEELLPLRAVRAAVDGPGRAAGFDDAGTFVGSSYLYADRLGTYARFGLFYLRDGIWDGRRILPEGWVDAARTIRSQDPDNGWHYGLHWWIRGDDLGTFWANGYEGQMVACVPELDVVVVRLGKMPSALRPATEQWFFDLLDALR